jgi:hypothetical protein
MYTWVSEGSQRKFYRAIAQINKENVTRKTLNQPEVPLTEEAIKALYIKWGGLVIGEEEETERGTPESEPAPITASLPPEAPRAARGRKAAAN